MTSASALAAGSVVTPAGHGPFVVVAHERDGFSRVTALGGPAVGVAERNALAAVPLLDADVSALEARALAWRHAKWAGRGLNELRLTPTGALHSGTARRLVIHCALSDFAAHAAAREFVLGADASRKRLWYSAGVCPPLSHGLAASVAVVTADLQLLLVRRAAETLAGEAWEVGIGESESVEDLTIDVEGRLVWDPASTARRGLREELGVPRVSYLYFHTLAVNLTDGSSSLFGVAGVPIDAATLRARIAQRSQDELIDAEFVPWSLAHAAQVLSDRPLAPWTPAKLVTAAVFCAGAGAVQRAGLLSLGG